MGRFSEEARCYDLFETYRARQHHVKCGRGGEAAHIYSLEWSGKLSQQSLLMTYAPGPNHVHKGTHLLQVTYIPRL